MTAKRIEGSLKNKQVASCLQEERDKCAFDKDELATIIFGGAEDRKSWDFWLNLIDKHPEIANHHKFFEMSPDEKQQDLWKRLNFLHRNYPEIFTGSNIGKSPYFLWGNLF